VVALLTWLDVHGAAVQGAAAVVQAGAALVTVVLTVVLIRVTTKYVRLTEQLARAATDEEQYRQIAARGRRAELAGLLDRLRQSVGSLPGPAERQAAERDMRAAALWEEDDLAAVERLAATMQPDRAVETAGLIGDLRWLAARAREVQTTDRRQGVDWNRFPWAEWTRRLANARVRP